MVVLSIYSKCLRIQYKTYLCSKATLFVILTIIISIVVPFIIAYSSRGFWMKHDTFYEQPNVRFKGEYLFNVITDDIRSPIACSNLVPSQDLSTFDRCSLIKVREIDNNKDNKFDEFKFSINANTGHLRVLSFYLILTFEYNLETVCPLQMQSAVILQHSLTNSDLSALNIDAHLGLIQTHPIYCHPKHKNVDYNYSVIQSVPNNIRTVIQSYSQRNVSTYLTNQYVTFTAGQMDSDLVINLRIKYSEHKIVYVPGFWQVIKWAWIQYFAIYVIFAWIMQRIRNYVFENRLLLFYEITPLKKNR